MAETQGTLARTRERMTAHQCEFDMAARAGMEPEDGRPDARLESDRPMDPYYDMELTEVRQERDKARRQRDEAERQRDEAEKLADKLHSLRSSGVTNNMLPICLSSQSSLR